jgi:hypothetical protein
LTKDGGENKVVVVGVGGKNEREEKKKGAKNS